MSTVPHAVPCALHSGTRFFVVGGAGFIGSHFVDRLLITPGIELVTIYDNFLPVGAGITSTISTTKPSNLCAPRSAIWSGLPAPCRATM